MSGFWSHCLNRFEQTLNAQQIMTWLKPLNVEEAEGLVRITAPNRFVAQWVKDKFLPDIETLADTYFQSDTHVQLVVGEETAAPPRNGMGGKPEPEARPRNDNALPVAIKVKPASGPVHPPEDSRLNPLFNFDTYVLGKANDLARAAALQVADNPGGSYNPLFVYGGVGLGKTHLIQAIGNKVRQGNPGARVSYIHAERYFSDMVRAIRTKSFEDFKRRYDSLDILLIDDIQFFANKDRTQEEFFYTFNTLIESHKQVIITSDTFPKDLEGIEERLKSRFSWGLTVMLEPPELEMRVAILMNKARQEGESLDDATAFFVAKQIRSNVRELEGALKRILAYSRFHRQPICVELAKEALKDLLAVQNRQISIENIQKTVADFYKIKVAEMYSKKRTRNLARPRQMAMFLAKELTDLSLPEIGQAFGGRDHTTVLHACRKIEELRNADLSIRRDYNLLVQVLTG
ncbi:MAG TPA: chromosomal replication initiator protein DnaA [Thiobacillaceae bacterium]|nr:chromosomal replication initiator protein DnaA [Thiobacillaceae bacterium]